MTGTYGDIDKYGQYTQGGYSSHIAPEIEVISADQIDEAWERVLASDVRYRFVIDISTIGNA